MKTYKWQVMHHCYNTTCWSQHRTLLGACFFWLYQYTHNHDKGIIVKRGSQKYNM